MTREITVQQISAMLDRLALEIEAFGDRGVVLLPLWRRLEEATSQLEADDDSLSAVRRRLSARAQGATP